MFWIKKIALLSGLLILIYGGSSGTQSSSLFIQAMSFIGLLIIAFILFFFARMLLRGLGCMPSLLIMAGVGLFMMYTLGMFNNGISGVADAVSRFIGRDQVASQPLLAPDTEQEKTLDVQEINEAAEVVSIENTNASPELFDDYKVEAEKTLENEMPKNEPKKGLLDQVVSAIMPEQQKTEDRPFNPNDFPVIYASARVLSGDMLEIRGRYFKLFGVAAPEISQTCADATGKSYNCGRQAAVWLKNWIENAELECHIIQQDTRGNMVGTCSYGPYDLGAALVNAGWAVAYTKYTGAYLPYEYQAQQNRRGLWQGQFYKPWDWKKIQARQQNVKVIRKKQPKIGLFGH